MRFYRLSRSHWESFFDDLSREMGRAELIGIRVADPDFGDLMAADDATLTGLAYDRLSDTFCARVESHGHSARHPISGPTEIWIDVASSEMRRVVVLDLADRMHIISLRAPVPLPPLAEEKLLGRDEIWASSASRMLS